MSDLPKEAKAVEVALAEFSALRSEIVTHITAQAAVVGLGLTAMGIIAGFVVRDGGDLRLLLAIPPIATLVVLLHTAETYRSAILGSYIRTELWPFLEQRVGALPSWELEAAKRRRELSAIVRSLFVDAPAVVIFIAAGVVALALNREHELAWWAGVALTAIAIAAPLAIALEIRRPPSSDLDPGPPQAAIE
jgi:hypothetical protein